MNIKTYKIDAKGRSLGRVASEAASVLIGKKDVNSAPHQVLAVRVVVSNVAALNFSGKKLKQKEYVSHSGYPGSQKFEEIEKLIAKKGMSEVLQRAVRGMIPKNKLNKLRMKNLIIEK